ncbi:MAG: hypothetical protein WCS35_04005 [Sphaerochaeta sp.]|jgi:hypothetical protein|nr:hypothetical protein [Spirochaetales bacterium]
MKMSIKRQSLARTVLISSVLLFLIISSLASAVMEATYVKENNPIIRNNPDHPLEYNTSDFRVPSESVL